MLRPGGNGERDQNLLGFSHEVRTHYQPAFSTEGKLTEQTGTSIFDPVLCECAYTWWTGPGFRVLDPFAGGSVRGVVAAYLGREYVGIDLRPEQVEENRRQSDMIFGPGGDVTSDPEALTPVLQLDDCWIKRDSAFAVAGVCGGKVRTAAALAEGAPGLVTAGARESPQVLIIAHLARAMGIPCRVHVPSGELTAELEQARALGADVVQHHPGRNSVLIARARDDAAERGWREIPFGMECQKAVALTRLQTRNLPADMERLVVPVGSAMSLAGILWGLQDVGRDVPVLGVVVGADPTKRLNKWAPPGWAEMVKLVDADGSYHDAAGTTSWRGVALDPIYEAKTIPWLQAGDCLWEVGIRPQAGGAVDRPRWIVGDGHEVGKLVDGKCDFLFSCPPYYDLEVYSDLPGELSAIPTYDGFLQAYRHIVADAVAKLRQDRFACFVVGDLRDQNGVYRNFVSDTIQAFRDAGCELYNEAILVTAVGSLPIRTSKLFAGGRKLGKTHQNVLVFVKGDWRRAVEACGPIEVALPPRFAEALETERN